MNKSGTEFNLSYGRQIQIQGMAYAPTTELGVVFLFGRLAPRLGFCIHSIHPRFPDCIATHRGRERRIEFELWASHYKQHRHSPKGADVIVCWENDWESRPKKYRHLEIIDLKKHVKAPRRIFVVGCNESKNTSDELNKTRAEWNVPKTAQVDDLVLIYRSKPVSTIKDIWKVVGPFHLYKRNNKDKMWPGIQSGLRRIAKLEKPLTFADLKLDSETRDSNAVRKKFRGPADITDHWPAFHKKIINLNPKLKSQLSEYRID